MYTLAASHAAPWWVEMNMPMRQTDWRTPDRYITLFARRGQRKKLTNSTFGEQTPLVLCGLLSKPANTPQLLNRSYRVPFLVTAVSSWLRSVKIRRMMSTANCPAFSWTIVRCKVRGCATICYREKSSSNPNSDGAVAIAPPNLRWVLKFHIRL